ncbi:vWA domain-containing protein [Streptomyces formicae]|uniref:VWA domain-containing protein n=1 Tax=Streptomyces formicae TaxID=1616117 RepID=A0ABY3WJJ5_9ACTN|nr:VWA domain-containing protein [Streptomyces formicae]UNM11865.1 VWA domain-containing protein [Streptomyces formicae]
MTPVDAPAVLVGFARALRAAGLDAGPDRVHTFLRALDALGPGPCTGVSRTGVYWAGRLTLCGSQDDLERYDRVFAAYFDGGAAEAVPRAGARRTVPRIVVRATEQPHGPGAAPDEEGRTASAAALASSAEVLRHRDVSELTGADREQLRRLLAAFALRGEPRRTPRLRPARHGAVDPRRTVREWLRRGGEPARLRRRTRAERPRRVVLLLDVSGSMAPYADALLRFAHAAAHGPSRGPSRGPSTGRSTGRSIDPSRGPSRTEVFTIGTRLTRVTDALSHRDPDTAMAAVSAAVPDWRGGTRIGETLRAFLDRWGRRGLARGAVVVILSDGWERDDPDRLATQMRRLHHLAHRVIWCNPRKARPGYAPLAAGMAAALPNVDAFVEGHSLAALERLAAVVRGVDDG